MTHVVNRLRRICALVSAIGFLTMPASGAYAAGAMAVGSCAAYGFAYDFANHEEARSAAVAKCTGENCNLVATIERNCVAFAIDGRNACGPHGYAVAKRLGQAGKTPRCAFATSTAARIA